ncbi:MAG: glycosyltransferase [Anaerolineales bacterium]|nr:glycosyltransferase [Anaerolineales bacterium]
MAAQTGVIETGTCLQDTSIICLANAAWDATSRVNCHHIMARLAPANRVLFVETIGGRRPGLTSARDYGKVARRLRRFAGGARQVSPNLHVLSPLALPGFAGALTARLNAALLRVQIEAAARRLFAATVSRLVWVFTPVFGRLAWQLPSSLLVYQCIDEHSAYPGAPTHSVAELEQALMRRADIVITSSNTLYEDRRRLHPQVVCLPNVADAPHFSRALRPETQVPDEISRLPKPIAGFIGNVSSFKVDFGLLAGLARRNPEWTFVLIGEVGIGEAQTDLAQLRALPNIILTGPRPYAELPAYLKGFDVCLIPFQLNALTRGVFPMKFFEYFASGKPVVATPLPTLQDYAAHCRLTAGVEDFSAALRQAASEDVTAAKVAARVQLALDHSWDERMVQLSRVICPVLRQKLTAVGRTLP